MLYMTLPELEQELIYAKADYEQYVEDDEELELEDAKLYIIEIESRIASMKSEGAK